MSGLNFTREEVYCDHEDASKTYSEELRQDWLAMYDLLKEIADDYIVDHRDDCDIYAEFGEDCDCGANELHEKIRALIGGGE